MKINLIIHSIFITGITLYSSPIDNNISYEKYLDTITKLVENTKNYYDSEMFYFQTLTKEETRSYQDGNYSELYYDEQYVSLVKNPYTYLAYAKKALYDKEFKHAPMVLNTLQCLKSEDYLKLGHELYNDHKVLDTSVLEAYIELGGEWGQNIHLNYESDREVKKLLGLIVDKNVSENITETIQKSIQNGRYKDFKMFYFLTKVRYAIEHPSEHNITWYPYSFCTDENTEKYPGPIIINW